MEYITSEKEKAVCKNALSADLFWTPKGGFIIVVIEVFPACIAFERLNFLISAHIGKII
jgi:hypothetical protein